LRARRSNRRRRRRLREGGPRSRYGPAFVKIAEIAPPWLAVPPKGYGGIEWVVALLTDGLVERGHDVTLFASGDSSTKAHLEAFFDEAPGARFINSIWHDVVHTAFALRDVDRFDLLHVHPSSAPLVAAAALNRPLVHTVHGPFNDQMKELYRLVAGSVWFVAISEAQRSHMPELPYAGVVYNGIDVSLYPFQPDKDDYVLFLGRAAPEKGAHRAVQAARAAGVHLVLAVKIANEEEEEHWAQAVEPILPADATVVGEISLEEKIDLLAGARAVLFPIDWDEPFGLVMTEAMACGTPVIATPRGSVPEIVVDGRTGFVVDVEEYPDRAAEALTRLDEIDPAACRSWVGERFSARAMVEGYELAFERALASSPSEGASIPVE
jgi:glycosyltransferase involved in cell wall biosynthesis